MLDLLRGKKEHSLPRRKKRKNKNASLQIFLIPAVLLTFLFSYVPMFGIILAFKDDVNIERYGFFDGMARANWTFDNFKYLFDDQNFVKAFTNTLFISILKIGFLFPIPIILAIMITELKSKIFSKTVQSIAFLPHFLSWAIVFGIFSQLFSTTGALNVILIRVFGRNETIAFLNKESFFWPLLIISAGWKEVGWNSIVYIAAIMAIDTSLYEAAKIDGASKMRQIWSITLPSIKSTIALLFILRLGGLLDAGFEQVMLFKNAQTASVGEIIGTLVYDQLRAGRYTFTTSVGLFNSVVAFILVFFGNMLSKKAFNHSIW